MTSISDIETSAAATQPEQVVNIIPTHHLAIKGVTDVRRLDHLGILTTMQLHTFIELHKKNAENDHMRLGQRFCDMYVAESTPELYYEADDAKAVEMIGQWLTKHGYASEWPPLMSRTNVLA